MKRVLVTGASGSIGVEVIKNLLDDEDYEITALDLDNIRSKKKLKSFNKKINIITGDICDDALIEALVRSHDVIIHLAGVMPPFSELSPDASDRIDYDGTNNIVKSINEYNKECHLIYASTTSIYKENYSNVSSKIEDDKLTYYDATKYEIERLIEDKLDNYTIIRVPLVLNNIKKESFMFNGNRSHMITYTTDRNAASAFTESIKHLKKLNKKIYNIGDGTISYNDLLVHILKRYGLPFKFILSRVFLEKNYTSVVIDDVEKLNDIINYRNDDINKYFDRLYRKNKNHKLRKILAKPIIHIMK